MIPSTQAQQTIFNVPSADLTPEGVVFVQHESQFRPFPPKQFWLLTQYNSLGLGHNVELTSTLFNVSAPASHQINLGVGFKSVIPLLKKEFPNREFKWVLGEQIMFPLEHSQLGNWAYTELSGRIPRLNTRLTAGLNYSTAHIFGKKTFCFIGGIEQPITKRFNIIADWYSGDSANGLFIPGVSYTLGRNQFFAGYQIPNPSNKLSSSGFVFEYARFFH